MKCMLQHSHLENAYFQNIMSRIAKNFSASNNIAGIESLNDSVVKFLGINYDNYKQINQIVQKSATIDAETKGLFAGIESVVTEGVGAFLNNHGYIVTIPDGLQPSEAYRVAVEAIKDEFEGSSDTDTDMNVSDNGDTNSAVIQAIIDDLKNRQASDVGKTVNLILKLNADKQKEMLDEEKENSEEINDTMEETDLTGSGDVEDDEDEDLADDGENPLDAKADDANDEGKPDDLGDGDEDELPPDSSLQQDSKKKSKGKASSKENAVPDSFGDNPFGGFESYEERYALNGLNGYEAGLELFEGKIDGTVVAGKGISLVKEFENRLMLYKTSQGIGKAFLMYKGMEPLDPAVFQDAVTSVTRDMLKYNLPRFIVRSAILGAVSTLARRAAEFRPTEKSIATHHTFGNVYKGKIYMQPKQYETAEKSVATATKTIASSIISKINKHPVVNELNKSNTGDKLILGNMFKEPLVEGEYTCFGYISPLLLAGIDPQGRGKKEMVEYVKGLTNTIFGEANTNIKEELTKVNAKHKGFEITLVVPKAKELKSCLLIGYKSNVVVSQVFTESEITDFMEGIVEGLNEYDPIEANAFMNGMENENIVLSLDGFTGEDEFNAGTEAFDLSGTIKLGGLITAPLAFIMEKIARYKAGENIFRKSIKMEPTVYNEQIKAMETALGSQTKYIEGVIRGINKTASWLAEVGAIKVIKKPQFVDGICVIVAYDAIHPISIDKKEKTLNYRNQSIPLTQLNISKFTALNPFKGLGSVLVEISKELNNRLNLVVKQHLDNNPLFGGVNPLKIPNGEAGWGVVAYHLKEDKSAKAGTESIDEVFGEYLDGLEAEETSIVSALEESREDILDIVKQVIKNIPSMAKYEEVKKQLGRAPKFKSANTVVGNMLKVITYDSELTNIPVFDSLEYNIVTELNSMASDVSAPNGQTWKFRTTEDVEGGIYCYLARKRKSEIAGAEGVDFTTEIPEQIEAYFFEEGTEGVINSIKAKYRSISLLKPTLEMTTQEYNSFANEFKTYGKEALDSLLIDIKNDSELGLLGLGRYLTTPNHTVTMDKKNRPQVLIYSAGTGLIPASYWKQFEDADGAVTIKAQNAKYDKLVKIIKKSLETFINTTKFKGMTVFPKISSNFSTVYAVIANPIKITAKQEQAVESHVFDVITGEYNGLPVFGTESSNIDYINSDYQLYNKLLGLSTVGAKIQTELNTLLSFDSALESAYNRIGDCVTYGDLNTMKVERPNSIRFTLAKLDLSNKKASVLFRNTMLEKLFNAASTVFKNLAGNNTNYSTPIIMNGENNSIEMMVPAVSNKLVVGTESSNILLALCDNYTSVDYNKDKKLDELAQDYGYQALGIESISTSNEPVFSFDTMVNIYRKLTKGGLDKRRAEYYTNSLFGIGDKSVAELSNYLGGIETEDIQIMKERASVLNTQYMSKLVYNIGKYSPISTYEETKRLMQESLDTVGEGNIKYYKDYGIILGFESGDLIGLAKGMVSRVKRIPSYAYPDIVQFANSIPQNVCIIPVNLGIESTDNLSMILKSYKETLADIEMSSNINSLADIKIKTLLGNIMHPFAGMESSLESHILKMNENARMDKLKEAYDMYGVESVEYRDILNQHKVLTLAAYDAYTSVILTASLFGLRYNKSGIYAINEF